MKYAKKQRIINILTTVFFTCCKYKTTVLQIITGNKKQCKHTHMKISKKLPIHNIMHMYGKKYNEKKVYLKLKVTSLNFKEPFFNKLILLLWFLDLK